MDAEHGSGTSKDSETHPVGIDGSGSSKHSEIHPEVIDGSGSSKHSETHPEIIDESDSSKRYTIHPEAFVFDGDLFAPAKKLQAYSSSSSDSSLEDLFLVVTDEVTKSGASTTFLPKPQEDAHPTLNGDEDNVLSKNSSKSEECDNGSLGFASTSPVSDLTHESMVHCVSPRQSPPIQVMDRSGGSEGYDPFRIPSAVFERSRSTTPVEWSVASNESLFSIHVGNNSFSRDHVFWLGGEVRKSGELTKSGELIAFNPHPPIPLVEPGRESVEMEKKLEETRVANETIKDETRSNAKDQGELKLPPPTVSWNSSTMCHSHHSHHSNGSEASTQSFAFPIKKKCAWPSCHCSNCSWAFCYCWNCSCKRLSCHCWNCKWPSCHCWKCKWPSCHCSNCSWAFCYCWNCSCKRLCCHCWNCKWPSCHCSNCSWAFCYCWNCCPKRLCCYSSLILTSEGEGSVSVKEDVELQHTHPEPSKKTSKPCANSWFSCFSCWSRRCSCTCR